MRIATLAAFTASTLAAGCGDNLAPATHAVSLTRAVRTADLPGCAWASPVLTSGENPAVIVATGEGIVIAYEPTGAIRWQLQLPAPPGQRAWIAATPAMVDSHLVVAWQDAAGGSRVAHHVGVVDVATGVLDVAFPVITLAASKPAFDGGTVTFNPATQFSRSTIAMIGHRVYISVGNIQDIQPWHGWVFEIDLDRWQTAGDPVTAVLLTTPETSCGPPGESGADDMICGGGVWAPSGPTVVGSELWIPTGNGQLDLSRGDYANSIMRVGAGLAFNPGCDARCAAFDPIAPDPGCMVSCKNLFMPRLRAGDPPLTPPGDRCAGLTFLQCYARLDLDLGADSPAVVEALGKRLVVLPAKDGAVYLFDADHFGTLHDRLALRAFCGSTDDDCTANWAGTMVTQPVVVDDAAVGGSPLVVVPTFYFDPTSPGGVVGLDVVAGPGGPVLHERWSAPERNDPEAITRFREHTGRAAIVRVDGTPYVVIADPGAEHSHDGLLYAIDARTGQIAERGMLDGPGEKYIAPAVLDRRVFVTSCDAIMTGPTHLEGWDLAP